MTVLANANIEEIFQQVPFAELRGDDIIVAFRPSTGETGGILGINTTVGDSSDFEWSPTKDYSFDEVVTFGGVWWQSLVVGIDTNTNNIPSQGPGFWNQINQNSGIVILPWTAGLFTEHYTVVREGTTLFALKNTAVLPYNSAVTPSLDLVNWEIIGGTGGGDQLNIDGGRPSRDTPTATEIDGGRPTDF